MWEEVYYAVREKVYYAVQEEVYYLVQVEVFPVQGEICYPVQEDAFPVREEVCCFPWEGFPYYYDWFLLILSLLARQEVGLVKKNLYLGCPNSVGLHLLQQPKIKSKIYL